MAPSFSVHFINVQKNIKENYKSVDWGQSVPRAAYTDQTYALKVVYPEQTENFWNFPFWAPNTKSFLLVMGSL